MNDKYILNKIDHLTYSKAFSMLEKNAFQNSGISTLVSTKVLGSPST